MWPLWSVTSVAASDPFNGPDFAIATSFTQGTVLSWALHLAEMISSGAPGVAT
jgi:hypothetical protein